MNGGGRSTSLRALITASWGTEVMRNALVSACLLTLVAGCGTTDATSTPSSAPPTTMTTTTSAAPKLSAAEVEQ